jgi:hypothetical protein
MPGRLTEEQKTYLALGELSRHGVFIEDCQASAFHYGRLIAKRLCRERPRTKPSRIRELATGMARKYRLRRFGTSPGTIREWIRAYEGGQNYGLKENTAFSFQAGVIYGIQEARRS